MSHQRAGRGSRAPGRVRSFRLGEAGVDRGCREISAEGELDLAVAGRLEAAIDRSDGGLTLIDLAACDFIDSACIVVIVRAAGEKAGEGGRIVVHSPNDQVLRVLEITGLLGNGLVFEDREAALAAAIPCR